MWHPPLISVTAAHTVHKYTCKPTLMYIQKFQSSKVPHSRVQRPIFQLILESVQLTSLNTIVVKDKRKAEMLGSKASHRWHVPQCPSLSFCTSSLYEVVCTVFDLLLQVQLKSPAIYKYLCYSIPNLLSHFLEMRMTVSHWSAAY